MIDQPWTMGHLQLDNRLVRSATDEGLSTENGAPTQRLIDATVELARGGVGLIVAGAAHIILSRLRSKRAGCSTMP